MVSFINCISLFQQGNTVLTLSFPLLTHFLASRCPLPRSVNTQKPGAVCLHCLDAVQTRRGSSRDWRWAWSGLSFEEEGSPELTSPPRTRRERARLTRTPPTPPHLGTQRSQPLQCSCILFTRALAKHLGLLKRTHFTGGRHRFKATGVWISQAFGGAH